MLRGFHIRMTSVAAVRDTSSKAYAIHEAPSGIIVMLKTACDRLIHHGHRLLEVNVQSPE